MLDSLPCLTDKETEAVTKSGTSETIHSPRASICSLSIPSVSHLAPLLPLQDCRKETETSQDLTGDPQHFGTVLGSREAPASGAQGHGGTGAEGGGRPGPRAAPPELGAELHPNPVVPSPFLLIVVAL